MTRKRKAAIAVGLGLAICALVAAANNKGIRYVYRRRRQLLDQVHLAQHVRGYFPRDWQDGSSIIVRSVEYFGAVAVETKWSRAGSQYRQYHGWPTPAAPEWSSPVQVSDAAKAAISDALNIAVRDRLWERGDISPPDGVVIVDGGEIQYGFVLGSHTGTLRLIQAPNVPDLRLFEHKVRIWTEDVRRRVQQVSPPQSGPANP